MLEQIDNAKDKGQLLEMRNGLTNYGTVNIADVRNSLEQRRNNRDRSPKVYRLVMNPGRPCEPNISDESRRICAQALIK